MRLLNQQEQLECVSFTKPYPVRLSYYRPTIGRMLACVQQVGEAMANGGKHRETQPADIHHV